MLGPDLARQFTRNTRFLTGQVEGISHDQSLVQPDFGANCLNWTVGHILQYRANVAALAGIDLPETGGLERYVRESDPVTEDGPGVVSFAALMERLSATEEPIAEALSAMSDEQMAETIETGDRVLTRRSRILFFYFHDTLHVGQADVLAELSKRA